MFKIIMESGSVHHVKEREISFEEVIKDIITTQYVQDPEGYEFDVTKAVEPFISFKKADGSNIVIKCSRIESIEEIKNESK